MMFATRMKSYFLSIHVDRFAEGTQRAEFCLSVTEGDGVRDC